MSKVKPYNTKSLYFSDSITEAMEGIFDHPLTIVEAPMGYGKTTAVREYLNHTEANVLWQRVYDSSPNGFWDSFGRLFREVDDYRSQSLVQLGFPDDSVSIQEALHIIEEIELTVKTVLVIDDYHLIDSSGVNRFIEMLVGNEVTNLHIVLTARFTELQSLEELTLKGYLHHVTKETFELMPKEIVAYYKLCGISLKATKAEELYAFTEGWISALYLLMLSFIAEGHYSHTANLYKLIEKAVYLPFSDVIKDFLLTMCIFDSFTVNQVARVWKVENPAPLIEELVSKNAFITCDYSEKTYYMHSILKKFLEEKLENKEKCYKEELYKKAAQWYMEKEEYLPSMRYAYLAGDFNSLLKAVDLDKGFSINSDYKDLIIKYFEECPNESKANFPNAMLIYARRLFSFNETALFRKVCDEFMTNVHNMDSRDEEYKNRLLGEFELLLSFTGYNDIEKMSEYHRRAYQLLKEPSSHLDVKKGSWTFGSPSVLYMFYRKTGELEKEVQVIMEAMPYYYQITNGHGKGAEYVMAAERYYNMGEFQNAEILGHEAFHQADAISQSGIIICAVFLEIRLALMKGDFPKILALFKKQHEDINNKKLYLFMHTLDMCEAYIYSCLNIKERTPSWIMQGEFKNTRLFFPTMAFLNIVYGRVLLINEEYLKLLGSAQHFMGIASVFPNLLGQIYTHIYLAAANKQIFRQNEAVDALKQALAIAMPDKVYMPFVENCDYIKPLLEKIYSEGEFRDDIAKILVLYIDWQKAVEQITQGYFTTAKPKLTEREMEIAELAAVGLTNKEIGERLFISPNTIKTQLKSIFEKLGVNSRALLKQSLDENK